MRKIEQAMNTAIANSTNWTSGNTTVHFNEEENISVVRLHGNKIAEIGEDFLRVFDGGWQTNTTKSRLNAIINRFCNGVTDGVFQKNYEWFVRDNNVTHDFVNGYTFAWLFQFFNSSYSNVMTEQTYNEILKVWNDNATDDFAIFSPLYYELFGEEGNIPYTTDSTQSAFIG